MPSKCHLISQWYVERSVGEHFIDFCHGKKKHNAALLPGVDEWTFHWLIRNTVGFPYVLPELVPLGFNEDIVKDDHPSVLMGG